MTAEHKVDLFRIAFPSDAITVAQLRRMFSTEFDSGVDPVFFGSGQFGNLANATVGTLLYAERSIADDVFNEAVGVTRRQSLIERADFEADLAAAYVRFGLATGPSHADELIRSIHRQATEQGANLKGKTP